LLFSQTAIGTLVASFARQYPEMRLEVTTRDRAVDMVEEEYDIVIQSSLLQIIAWSDASSFGTGSWSWHPLS